MLWHITLTDERQVIWLGSPMTHSYQHFWWSTCIAYLTRPLQEDGETTLIVLGVYLLLTFTSLVVSAATHLWQLLRVLCPLVSQFYLLCLYVPVQVIIISLNWHLQSKTNMVGNWNRLYHIQCYNVLTQNYQHKLVIGIVILLLFISPVEHWCGRSCSCKDRTPSLAEDQTMTSVPYRALLGSEAPCTASSS